MRAGGNRRGSRRISRINRCIRSSWRARSAKGASRSDVGRGCADVVGDDEHSPSTTTCGSGGVGARDREWLCIETSRSSTSSTCWTSRCRTRRTLWSRRVRSHRGPSTADGKSRWRICLRRRLPNGAKRSADARKWRGLSLYGLDGTTIRVPDSPENRAAFGGSYAGALRGESGYPQVRAVAVMALRSHVMSAFRFADYATGETTLARDVWSEVPEDSLVIVDRNFPGRARAHSPREQRQSPLAVAGEDANALLGRRKARHRRRTGRRRSRPARSPPAVG